MTAKSPRAAKPDPTNCTLVVPPDGKTNEQRFAKLAVSPQFTAAMTVLHYSGKYCGGADLTELFDQLNDKAKSVHEGRLTAGETMLVAQAHALDVIFHEMARRAALNMNEHLEATDKFLRVALRAQAQCRATWETLAAIKNPPQLAFVKQANIAHGPQQVNNGGDSPAARARESAIEPNELSRIGHEEGQRLDLGTTGKAGAAHPAMEAVGAVHRAEDEGR